LEKKEPKNLGKERTKKPWKRKNLGKIWGKEFVNKKMSKKRVKINLKEEN